MKRYRVKPGSRVDLAKIDPGSTAAFKGNKAKAGKQLLALNEKLEALQEALWAENKHKVLVVLQGMDTSGKDGVIRHVFEGVDPQGVQVASFKVPTPEELDHDFLWRVHRKVPGQGEMVIFNRSHYEDVLAVRILNLAPPEVWRPRFDQINEFERFLTQTGTSILKFFLHISSDEQRARLRARLDDPAKRWKFRKGDLAMRGRWDDHMAAYEEALTRTSTEWAPWHVVPSDKKWYRNLVVGSILVKALEGLKIKIPEPAEDLTGVVIE